jgi:cytidylate kinase
MPVICIAGLSGSGKNAAGEALAKRLKLRIVSVSFKDYAREHNMNLMDVQKLAGKDSRLDKDLDAQIVSQAAKGNCVVMTWLGPWMVKGADLRVWIHADEPVRAKRVAKRDGMGEGAALEHVRTRDADNRARYKKIYGIDIGDHSIFDLEIDSGKYLPDEIAAMIEAALKKKGKK